MADSRPPPARATGIHHAGAPRAWLPREPSRHAGSSVVGGRPPLPASDSGVRWAAAVDDEQDRLLGVKAAVDEIGQQRPCERGVLGRAFPEPERDLDAVGADARARRRACDRRSPARRASSPPAARRPAARHQLTERGAGALDEHLRHRRLRRRRGRLARHRCRRARRPRANLRVETPASIRSITARVSGSRSAKYS